MPGIEDSKSSPNRRPRHESEAKESRSGNDRSSDPSNNLLQGVGESNVSAGGTPLAAGKRLRWSCFLFQGGEMLVYWFAGSSRLALFSPGFDLSCCLVSAAEYITASVSSAPKSNQQSVGLSFVEAGPSAGAAPVPGTAAAAAAAGEGGAVTYPHPKSFSEKLMFVLESRACPETIWWAKDGKAVALHVDNLKNGSVLKQFFNDIRYKFFIRNFSRWYVSFPVQTG